VPQRLLHLRLRAPGNHNYDFATVGVSERRRQRQGELKKARQTLEGLGADILNPAARKRAAERLQWSQIKSSTGGLQ